MEQEIEKIPEEPVKAGAGRRKGHHVGRWLLALALLVLAVVSILSISQRSKETYEYQFVVAPDTVSQATVGLENISVTHRWTFLGGLCPKIVLCAVADVPGTKVRYGQFVFKDEDDREWNYADATRHRGHHYWLTLRDIPEGKVVGCMFVAVTQDGRKLKSELYAFSTQKMSE